MNACMRQRTPQVTTPVLLEVALPPDWLAKKKEAERKDEAQSKRRAKVCGVRFIVCLRALRVKPCTV